MLGSTLPPLALCQPPPPPARQVGRPPRRTPSPRTADKGGGDGPPCHPRPPGAIFFSPFSPGFCGHATSPVFFLFPHRSPLATQVYIPPHLDQQLQTLQQQQHQIQLLHQEILESSHSAINQARTERQEQVVAATAPLYAQRPASQHAIRRTPSS